MLAEARVEPVLGEGAEVLDRFAGARDARAPPTSRRSRSSPRPSTAARGHTVLAADFVSADDGTGLVHTAIAFGEDDFRLGEQYGLTVVNPVRRRRHLRRAHRPVRRALREGRRPGPDRGPQGARPAAPRRAVRARLSALLALRHAAALLREGELVHPHDGASSDELLAANEDDRAGTRTTSSTGASASGSRTTSTGRCRASATGARRCRCGAARRGTTRCVGSIARAAGAGGRSVPEDPAPALHRRRRVRLPRVRRRDAPRAGGDRRLVRLGRDAVRAVPLPVREHEELFEQRFPADFICEALDQTRGWFYSLLAESTLLFGRASYKQRALPGPDPRPRGPEDVEEPRQRGRALGRDRPPRRGRVSLVLLHLPAAVVGVPLLASRRSARACASSCSRCGTRTASTCCTRTSTGSTTTARSLAGRSAAGARPLGPVAAAGHGRGGARRARRLRHDLAPAARSPPSSTTSPTGTCAAAGGASGGAATRATSRQAWPPT